MIGIERVGEGQADKISHKRAASWIGDTDQRRHNRLLSNQKRSQRPSGSRGRRISIGAKRMAGQAEEAATGAAGDAGSVFGPQGVTPPPPIL